LPEYFPPGHAPHDPLGGLLLYWPAAQSEHDVALASEYWPELHAAQVDASAAWANFPAGHGVHDPAFVLENFPAGHVLHVPALSAENFPAGHVLHCGSGLLAQPALQLQVPQEAPL
jgi:hypothetical protein